MKNIFSKAVILATSLVVFLLGAHVAYAAIPTITSIAPSSATAGGGAFTLTVNGNNFTNAPGFASLVRWNGVDKTTTFVSPVQVTASIPASDISSAGSANLTVFNPGSGGGTSNAQPFTISSAATATLTIVKIAQGGDGTFTFTIGGPTQITPNPVTIDTSVKNTSDPITVNTPTNPTDYTIDEAALEAGWQPVSIECKDGQGNIIVSNTFMNTITVPIKPGQDVTCTFTNSYSPPSSGQTTLTIVKTVEPARPGSGIFIFDVQGPTSTDSFPETIFIPNPPLTVSGPSHDVSPGQYTITETLPLGGNWFSSGIVCTDQGGNQINPITLGALTITIYISDGQQVTCTFTNYYYSSGSTPGYGNLIIVKTSIGGTDTFGYFIYPGLGIVPVQTQDPDGDGNGYGESGPIPLAEGTYLVQEILPGFTWEYTFVTCSEASRYYVGTSGPTGVTIGITIIPNTDLICYFTNTRKGQLIIDKDSYGGLGTFDYEIYPTNQYVLAYSTFVTTQDQGNGDGYGESEPVYLTAGNYAIYEELPPGWIYNPPVVCTTDGQTVTVTQLPSVYGVTGVPIQAGKITRCTFTNTMKGTLEIVKHTTGGDDKFEFNISPGFPQNVPINTAAGQGTSGPLPVDPDTYDVREIFPSGWVLTDADCSYWATNSTTGVFNPAQDKVAGIVIGPGQYVTCHFYDTKLGDLKIVKKTKGGDRTFRFDVTAAGTTGPILDTAFIDSAGNPPHKIITLYPRSYDIAETIPPGWGLTSATCDNGSGSLSSNILSGVTVASGATTTCTFNDTNEGGLLIEKIATNDDGSFGYDISGGGISKSLHINTVGGLGSVGPIDLLAGPKYTISEKLLKGWKLDDISCTFQSGAPTGIKTYKGSVLSGINSIEIIPGELTTCTFTNTAYGRIKIIKNTTGGDEIFYFNITGPTNPAPPQVVIATNNGTGVTDPAITVATGQNAHTIEEVNIPTGWTLDSMVCVIGKTSTGTFDKAGHKITNVSVQTNKVTTCTVLDTYAPVPPDKAGITVIKTTSGADGTFSFNVTDLSSGSVVQNPSITTSGGSASSGQMLVDPGNYSVTENQATGWNLVAAYCVDENGFTGSSSSSGVTGLSLQGGKTTICIFENEQQGSLIIVKKVNGPDETFQFDIADKPPPSLPITTSVTTNNGSGTSGATTLDSDNYTVTETAPIAWDLVSVVCNNQPVPYGPGASGNTYDAYIQITAGQPTTCTFTNNYQGIPPRSSGTTETPGSMSTPPTPSLQE